MDDDLLAAAHTAVAEGRARTLSAWINDALRLKVDHDALVSSLDALIGGYETRFGAITDEEIAEAFRRANAAPRGRAPKAVARAARTRRGQGAA